MEGSTAHWNLSTTEKLLETTKVSLSYPNDLFFHSLILLEQSATDISIPDIFDEVVQLDNANIMGGCESKSWDNHSVFVKESICCKPYIITSVILLQISV